MKKLFIALTILISNIFYLQAQQNNGIITGKLVDSSTGKPLSFATIAIYKAKDSSLFTYRMSDPSGNYKVTGMPLNIDLRILISFSGYRVFRKEVHLSNDKPNESFGAVMLVPDARSLDEVLVYSERPPVIVRKDTIEFNASSFKTLPAALVEDLLKKMPGIDINTNGDITVNGRPVSRILVDGRDFFGGDPKLATRNLPANIIDKVQVMEDKEQLERNPMLVKSEINQVINLKLKKSIKKGWFGKVYAGAGTNDRNEVGAIINSFRDTLQISMLGYFNNLNKSGFSVNELTGIGGFKRSGVRSITQTSNGGIGLNGISFGGMGEGIVQSGGAGININSSLKKNLNLNLMYFMGRVESSNKLNRNIVQRFSDTSLTIKENQSDNDISTNHRIGAKIDWAIDSVTNAIYQPSVIFSKTNFTTTLVSNSVSNYKGPVNKFDNLQQTISDNLGYSHELSLNRFTKRKYNIRFSNLLSVSNGDNDKFTNAVTDFYSGPLSQVNQLQGRTKYKLNSETSLSIRKTFSKRFNASFIQSLTNISDDDNLNVYELNNSTGKYEVYNPLLSNKVERNGIRSTTSILLNNKTKRNASLSGTVRFVLLNLANKFDKFSPINQRYSYFLPSFNYSLDDVTISYTTSVKEPSTVDLQPVIDNSNPLFQVLGNPELEPGYSHTLSLFVNKYNQGKLLSINYGAEISAKNNEVIRERLVDKNGVQFTKPVNKDGVLGLYTWVSINKQYKYNSKSSFSWRAGYNGDYGKTYTVVNNKTSKQYYYQLIPFASVTFNWKDKVEVSQNYSYTWDRYWYSSSSFKASSSQIHSYSGDIIIRVPKKVVWESNLNYSHTTNMTPGFKPNSLRWNVAVNYQFLKDNKGNIKLSVYDLLKQNAGISRVLNENYVRDTEQTLLTRYFLLMLSYNIRDFKAQKIGRADTFFRF